jgi:hypothetical protein
MAYDYEVRDELPTEDEIRQALKLLQIPLDSGRMLNGKGGARDYMSLLTLLRSWSALYWQDTVTRTNASVHVLMALIDAGLSEVAGTDEEVSRGVGISLIVHHLGWAIRGCALFDPEGQGMFGALTHLLQDLASMLGVLHEANRNGHVLGTDHVIVDGNEVGPLIYSAYEHLNDLVEMSGLMMPEES